jgi:two-component system CheB/CheR fusion protein
MRVAKNTGRHLPGKTSRSSRAPYSPRLERRTSPGRNPSPTAVRPVSAAAVAGSADERTPGISPAVVGVGASAGGLEAFTELLSHLPDDTGMAFVLIQHLDPKHESHLAELLSKASKMPVSEVKGQTRAEANHVYVIPPQCNLGISDGVLDTSSRPDSGRNMPVDSFLRALAADRGSRAIGVILSGTASDGTLGLQAIKAARGITFAQETETAKYDGMPKSAIAAGVVDFVLPPAAIARQLVAIARNSHVPVESREPMEPSLDPKLARILRLVRSATGVDFTHYKQSTLTRRIKRRMVLRGFDTLEAYSRDLERSSGEARALCETCLITVTQFFREPGIFEELEEEECSPPWLRIERPRIQSGSGYPAAPPVRRRIRSPFA